MADIHQLSLYEIIQLTPEAKEIYVDQLTPDQLRYYTTFPTFNKNYFASYFKLDRGNFSKWTNKKKRSGQAVEAMRKWLKEGPYDIGMRAQIGQSIEASPQTLEYIQNSDPYSLWNLTWFNQSDRYQYISQLPRTKLIDYTKQMGFDLDYFLREYNFTQLDFNNWLAGVGFIRVNSEIDSAVKDWLNYGPYYFSNKWVSPRFSIALIEFVNYLPGIVEAVNAGNIHTIVLVNIDILKQKDVEVLTTAQGYYYIMVIPSQYTIPYEFNLENLVILRAALGTREGSPTIAATVLGMLIPLTLKLNISILASRQILAGLDKQFQKSIPRMRTVSVEELLNEIQTHLIILN
ncbi:Hypothetical protein HVR_LOCUS577 [uncultured virus]|nr:Hypothetical protein HVR_LOCUS577 [uncultured virus]